MKNATLEVSGNVAQQLKLIEGKFSKRECPDLVDVILFERFSKSSHFEFHGNCFQSFCHRDSLASFRAALLSSGSWPPLRLLWLRRLLAPLLRQSGLRIEPTRVEQKRLWKWL